MLTQAQRRDYEHVRNKAAPTLARVMHLSAVVAARRGIAVNRRVLRRQGRRAHRRDATAERTCVPDPRHALLSPSTVPVTFANADLVAGLLTVPATIGELWIVEYLIVIGVREHARPDRESARVAAT